MLSLAQFHLRLDRVQPGDLEEIRQGRNSDAVRRNHLFREEISPAMQHAWYESIQTPFDYYFVIRKRGTRIGLAHISEISHDLAQAQYGLFIWSPEYRGSPIPVLTTLMLLDFFFTCVGVQKISGKVLKTNEPIQRICRFFHFHLDETDNAEYLHTWSDQAGYRERRPGLLAFAEKFVHDEAERRLRLSGTPGPLLLPEIKRCLA